MDEEASFSALLSSTTPARPSWSTQTPNDQADDPWANPFSDSSSSINPYASPFASTVLPSSSAPINDPAIQPFALPESPRNETSPYAQKINEDYNRSPDPPSVIAAREQQQQRFSAEPQDNQGIYSNPYGNHEDVDPFASAGAGQNKPIDPAHRPFEPPSHSPVDNKHPQSHAQSPTTPKPRGLPSSLIDEDLMAESDPEQSLKKAFVKSAPAPKSKIESTNGDQVKPTPEKKKTYVFTPNSKAVQEEKKPEAKSAVKETGRGERQPDDNQKKADETKQVALDAEIQVQSATKIPQADSSAQAQEPPSSSHTTPTVKSPKSPTSIPLPASNLATPTVSRVPTPLPPATNKADNTEASSVLATPSSDRVSVSPLDAPAATAADVDYGFKSLALGGSAPPVPDKEWTGTGNAASSSESISPPSSRFGGKGWGALDDEPESDSLFGRGGPSTSSWGNNDSSGGWGETSMEETLASAGPSTNQSYPYDTNGTPSTSTSMTLRSDSGIDGRAPASPVDSISIPTTSSPRKKLSNIPVFQITVSDPAKVGDPVRGYTVYTVRTQTTSPHYRKGSFSVLRRFSDFLWLLEILTFNNPGIVLPPMPGKHTFGRFQDQFIETRRNALQKFITKITSHPVLQLDPDLRIFLESDSFAIDSKNRKAEVTLQEKAQSDSLLGSWTGSNKFAEFDDWFESRNGFLNSLENQLKNLSKSIESSSKSKLELSNSISEFSESLLVLSESDLNMSLVESLKELWEISNHEKEIYEDQAKFQVINLLNTTDEYVKIIQQVRIAFNGRIKAYHTWQNGEKDLTRLRNTREKLRNSGKLNERANSSLNEIVEAERTVRENHMNFENLTKLTKSEFVRFERERIEEFKNTLEVYLNDLIEKQKTLIEMWEGFHKSLVGVVDKHKNGD
ncbi:uncharacterized protein I303_105348 [Kwoniella dejecticola CBS 10117]|uniref:PX domain-containing protein n=1 Tax=Kwoniella dejecticola CBS 10117 TaxID=1296121 RepID=A0A1A6A2R1_9TREE|nr:uncharacterized protein I303_05205 [Kwoniella dejecticola CBS 10117]OBR84347.1 hypothetical protein I303_05205 [Kwoniella dejecticola CBS 10117]